MRKKKTLYKMNENGTVNGYTFENRFGNFGYIEDIHAKTPGKGRQGANY